MNLPHPAPHYQAQVQGKRMRSSFRETTLMFSISEAAPLPSMEQIPRQEVYQEA
jgi:hypothetical protein